MRFFLRSKQFKIIVSVIAAVLVIAVAVAVIGGVASPLSSVIGAVFTPVQSAFNKVTGTVKNFFTAVAGNERLMEENERLQGEIDRLTSDSVKNENAARENEFYKNYLDIKDAHPDFEFQPASIIAQDRNDLYRSFVINKGSLDSVARFDPVINDSGLIGYVTEVALSYSKVTTVLSADIRVGAKDNRTGDIGVIEGGLELAKDGLTKMVNLPRSSSITVGDYIVTSGGGIFPAGLIVGTIESIEPQQTDISVYAAVKPAVQLDSISDVMIITSFTGQGAETFAPGDKE